MHLNTTIEAKKDFVKWQLGVGNGMHTDNVSPSALGSSWMDWSHTWKREAYLRRALEKLNLEYSCDSND